MIEHPPGSPEDLADQVRIEVDGIIEEADGNGVQSIDEIADGLEQQILEGLRGDGADEAFWRTVAAELRRRAARGDKLGGCWISP
jgi:hypothetical protein